MPPLLLLLCVLAGCGGSTRTVTQTVTRPPPRLMVPPRDCIPPEGQGVVGACTPKPAVRLGQQLHFGQTSGGVIPDVSEFQGHPDWSVAVHHIDGAIVRVQDNNYFDHSFGYNVQQLQRLHVWFAVYAFVRPAENCGQQASMAYGRMALFGVTHVLLIADAEVPLPFFCVAQFNAAVESHSGLQAVDYTSPGTYSGGPHGRAKLWVAVYGSFRQCVPGWACNAHGEALSVAWQHTDGLVGPFPHSVPGIGSSDLSRNEGITGIFRPAPKPLTQTELKRRLAYHEAKHHTFKVLIDGPLRGLPGGHQCRRGDHRHATPHTRNIRHACNVWLSRGKREARLSAYYRTRIHN